MKSKLSFVTGVLLVVAFLVLNLLRFFKQFGSLFDWIWSLVIVMFFAWVNYLYLTHPRKTTKLVKAIRIFNLLFIVYFGVVIVLILKR